MTSDEPDRDEAATEGGTPTVLAVDDDDALAEARRVLDRLFDGVDLAP